MGPRGHEPWQGANGRERAEGAGMDWGPFMGPWGHGAMSHGKGGGGGHGLGPFRLFPGRPGLKGPHLLGPLGTSRCPI